MSRSPVAFISIFVAAATGLTLAGGCSAILDIDNEYGLEERGATSSESAGGGGAAASSGGGLSSASNASGSAAGSGGGGAAGTGGGGQGGGPVSVCGNGIIEGGEECDEGNAVDTDYCVACEVDCQLGFEHPTTHHCYGYIANAMTWANAQSACASFAGGHLAALTTKDEIAFILATSPPQSEAWIGASDLAVEGTFAWVTGEAFTFAPKEDPWDTGKPNSDGNCVEMRGPGLNTGKLNDEHCEIAKTFFCERSPDGMLP